MVTTAPNLTQGRTTVSEEIGAVPVVPLKWFLGNLLPYRSKVKDGLSVRVKHVKKALISNGAWRKQEPKGWSAFPATHGASKLEGNEIFQSFRQVVEAIRKATRDSNINSYLSQPNTTPFSERNNMSRPDGFFVLGNVAGATRPSWPDIIGSTEFELKRDEDACRDNNNKITWSMHHIMREDARRRFTFGITIEDTSTRFRFASRSVVLVSGRFNFMEEPGPLIQMVTFLLYASEEQLGYDMTIRRNQSQLAIDLSGRTFQTTGLLANFADSPLGRGTRVWKGFFTDDPERKSAVLKDCWAECDRELEGDVLATLRRKYAKLRKRNKPNFDDHFLTVAAHGKIRLAGGLEDDTHAMMNDRLPVADHWLDVTRNSGRPHRSAGIGKGSDPQEAECSVDRELNFRKRCHYRISFEEVGKPLHDVTNLRDYMAALRDTIIAIKILHWLGYVHRDISSGNVLLCNGRGKLSDL
ncbi:hypothetical protein BD779DRAFT_1650263 [Infundibulicybe gibba]|nr:hypothetical protein BD779DRAFT_1650263 [Infundibulicybe gibba]